MRASAPSLLVDISAHGFGHVGQTAPAVNALARRIPGLHVVVRSAAPADMLRSRFHCDFRHIPVALDFGMKMLNAVDVQVAESAAAYQHYHADWDAHVQLAAQAMRDLRPDLLLANVPYVSLAAARAAGVRAAAMCCLNWADIYRYYFSDVQGADDIHTQMLAAYNSAEVFLKVQPAMPMPDLRNARSIAPIAQPGQNRRAEIDGQIQTAADKLVLVAMGGIAYRLPMENWPRIPGVRWLVPQGWKVMREDATPFEALGPPFSDVLASCDAVLTKPGYGTFAEAAVAGVPVLYVLRRGWPEEPYLVRWLEQNGACREVARERLQSGALADDLDALWAQSRPLAPQAAGIGEAATILASMLQDR